jgi:hypothetical protein
MADIQESHGIDEPVTLASPLTSQQPALAPTGNGLGVASLIVGIVALLGALVPIITFGAGIVALVGLVFGIVALRRRNRRRGFAIAGTTVSGGAVLLSIVFTIVYPIVLALGVGEASPAAPMPVHTADQAGPGDGAAAYEVGSRENPAPLGTTVEVRSAAGTVDWEVTLGRPTLDAGELLAADAPATEPAAKGFQYAMVPVTVVYRGTETGTPWAEFAVDFVSAAGATHTATDTFAVAPTPLTDVKELAPGASGSGNVVVSVPMKDVAKGAWVVTSMVGDRYFFAAR